MGSSTSVSILGKAVCGLSLITCDSFAVRALARFSLVRFVSIRGGGGCAPPSTVRGSPPQLFIDLQLASKHVITRVRGKRVPWTTSSSLPIAATIHARACVCVYDGFEGGGCLVLEAKIPRSVFDGAECCRVTWNIGFGGERTVPRSENSFSVEASQRFAIIVDFYLLKEVEKTRSDGSVYQSKGCDEILDFLVMKS